MHSAFLVLSLALPVRSGGRVVKRLKHFSEVIDIVEAHIAGDILDGNGSPAEKSGSSLSANLMDIAHDGLAGLLLEQGGDIVGGQACCSAISGSVSDSLRWIWM